MSWPPMRQNMVRSPNQVAGCCSGGGGDGPTRVVGWPLNGKSETALPSRIQINMVMAQAQFANLSRLSWAARSTLRSLPVDSDADWKYPPTGSAGLVGQTMVHATSTQHKPAIEAYHLAQRLPKQDPSRASFQFEVVELALTLMTFWSQERGWAWVTLTTSPHSSVIARPLKSRLASNPTCLPVSSSTAPFWLVSTIARAPVPTASPAPAAP